MIRTFKKDGDGLLFASVVVVKYLRTKVSEVQGKEINGCRQSSKAKDGGKCVGKGQKQNLYSLK